MSPSATVSTVPLTPPQAARTAAPPGNWPRDILEAYARSPGPYTIENAETILEEETVELYNGWLVWQEMTDAIERRVVATLQGMLDLSARKAGFGQVLPDQLECLLSDGSVVKPDTSLISWRRFQERVQPYGPRHRPTLIGAPELVVEVRSPSNRRAQERSKRALYFANHAQFVWDVDPIRQSILVYPATTPADPAEYRLPDEIDCALLPGWRRRVMDIFAEQASAEAVAGEVAQIWRAEGRAEGRVEGRVEGRTEGRAEGRAAGREEGVAAGIARTLRDVLPSLVRLRFGIPLPADLPARLESCSLEQLQHLQTLIETASSLEDWLQALLAAAC